MDAARGSSGSHYTPQTSHQQIDQNKQIDQKDQNAGMSYFDMAYSASRKVDSFVRFALSFALPGSVDVLDCTVSAIRLASQGRYADGANAALCGGIKVAGVAANRGLKAEFPEAMQQHKIEKLINRYS